MSGIDPFLDLKKYVSTLLRLPACYTYYQNKIYLDDLYSFIKSLIKFSSGIVHVQVIHSLPLHSPSSQFNHPHVLVETNKKGKLL